MCKMEKYRRISHGVMEIPSLKLSVITNAKRGLFPAFKRRSDYSVGIIYFVIMNLPRSETFKFENVILGGIIPSLES